MIKAAILQMLLESTLNNVIFNHKNIWHIKDELFLLIDKVKTQWLP